VLKCLLQLVQNFPGLPEAKISGKYTHFIFCVVVWLYTFAFLIKCRICTAILPSLWQTFVSSFKIYHLSSIQGLEELDSINYDSDGSERSLESFEIQVILRQFPVGHWIFLKYPTYHQRSYELFGPLLQLLVSLHGTTVRIPWNFCYLALKWLIPFNLV